MLKIFPTAIVKNQCIICMNEEKKSFKNLCNQCKTDWEICTECNDKIDKCPICNNTNYKNKIKNNNKINIQNNKYYIFLSKFLEFLWLLTKYILYFIIIVYIGKLYIFWYCTGTCPKEDENDSKKCLCGKYARQDNYWEKFNYCILDFLCCVIVSSILYSCCCIKN